jgi:hypothetical protein
MVAGHSAILSGALPAVKQWPVFGGLLPAFDVSITAKETIE